MKTGLYGDMCPRCWEVERKEVSMTILHKTSTHDYSAPSGHNGNVVITVEWCAACGTVRHIIDYEGDTAKRISLHIVGDKL